MAGALPASEVDAIAMRAVDAAVASVGLGIFFELDFMTETIAALAELGVAANAMKGPLARTVKDVLIPSIQKNFAAGGRPVKWPTLSPLKFGTDDVVLSGEVPGGQSYLQRSMKLKTVMAQFSIWTVTADTAFIDNGSMGIQGYGIPNQNGAVVGYGAVLPPRPFAVIQPEDVPKIEAIFAVWLEELIAASGLSDAY